ncbi:putative thiamine biosynthesis oxidoreductase ThiO [Beijerinckiaceae bacterium RH AL1]|nr:FAD-dependent oxidoreductase [Beijerinckiaceae bacterium]VVB42265.1 putative thiamine biosynthesis oxidoreductase ThiO [Beijerinckiaceae bacterium RH AL8]VVB42266.1 putative thiamine biosynthesis oxidoreductase ThiO [Beijerinckiaceae bacterium RH CH11]VVC53221.1 putative thiamine biosynthesis oxidoreductase ThiO [Beijerinckiaceae bacterium RH AL1]
MAPTIAILGAGIAGLTAADAFLRAGCEVTVVERNAGAGQGCSHYAGGMIAPYCEAEAEHEPLIVDLGREALAYWRSEVPVALTNGSLLVAAPRDLPELTRFGRGTTNFETLDAAGIAALEPDLAGRFSRALFFRQEAHLDPRVALAELARRVAAHPRATLAKGTDKAPQADWTIDCRGFAARDRLPDLRGVKGEMVVLATKDIAFQRPVQLLHPRTPVYIVPRGDGRFMVGATMIENEERGRVRARALLDLIGAAYTIHPAFGEAEVVEIGCDLRPAFPDNLPRLRLEGRRLFINGLYRHGFLLAPALAARAVRVVLEGKTFPELQEGRDADHAQRHVA